VDGTVLAAESYLLYGRYPDLRVYILIDGHPGYHVAVLHMSSLAVSRGQRVEAGKTVIGTVRDLVPYFHSGPNDYTREEGNHAHVQIDYRPDMHL
jgi:murein DD-endopeptidase MepM/ murein hydrolase activator NlpD